MAFDLSSYEPVEDRLRQFWADHPDGRIETILVEHRENTYIMQASVWRDSTSTPPASTGFAHEVETERGVNATSALENCETSAIGRALANLGYAPKGKRPSREEMAKTVGAPRTRDMGKVPASESPTCKHESWSEVPNRPGLLKCDVCGVGKKA